MTPSQLTISLPDWLAARSMPSHINSITERLQLVLDIARDNVSHASGGPFAAAVFALDNGELLAIACNRVVPEHCSIAHAEMLAIGLAQQRLQQHSLNDQRGWQLVSSAEPCAMCTAAIDWSGIRDVVYGAGRDDVETIGFNEGNKPDNWREALENKGIRVHGPLLQKQATDVLQYYRSQQGIIYNP